MPVEVLVHSLAYVDIFLFSSGYKYSSWPTGFEFKYVSRHIYKHIGIKKFLGKEFVPRF